MKTNNEKREVKPTHKIMKKRKKNEKAKSKKKRGHQEILKENEDKIKRKRELKITHKIKQK